MIYIHQIVIDVHSANKLDNLQIGVDLSVAVTDGVS